MTFITEGWLRDNFTLSEGSEIHLPADSRMTPSARELIESRRLQVKFQDKQGRLLWKPRMSPVKPKRLSLT